MSGYSQGRVSLRHQWAPGLITLQVDAEIERFRPGQFVNLALELKGELVKRSYSIASAPGSPLQFYLALVPEGELSPTLFELPVGAEIMVEKKPQGFFTLDYVPAARDLWMVATGTGLGPFIAMLRSEETWQRFERIVVVHGVRRCEQLAYGAELQQRSAEHAGKLVRVPVVSRQPEATEIHGRVTSALVSGELERAAGVSLEEAHTHLMLCGNPAMISDMQAALTARGLRKHRVRNPGHISIEKYW